MSVYRDRLREIYNKTMLGSAWFSWYDFPSLEHVLLVGDIAEESRNELKRKFAKVTQFSRWEFCTKEKFSAILVGDGLGDGEKNKAFLQSCRQFLTDDGVLLWAVDNKMGSRFLVGDSHLGNESEYYNRVQWENYFTEAGMQPVRVYYLLPGWHCARTVLTDRWYDLATDTFYRIKSCSVEPEHIFGNEHLLLQDVVECHGLSLMANSFLFEYRLAEKDNEIVYADMSPDKGRDLSSVLICYSNETVSKRPLYHGGSVRNIYRYGEELRQRGLPVIKQVYEDNRITMPFVKQPLVSKVMARAARESVADYRKLWEKFWGCILKSSELSRENEFPIKNIDCGVNLAKAYLDMVPTNAFFVDGEFVFFDQEYCCANYPAKFVLYRAMVLLYSTEKELECLVPLAEVKKWFDMEEVWAAFHYVDQEHFVKKVKNNGLYAEFNKRYVSHVQTISRNKRVLANIDKYAEEDLFADTEGKDLVIFGSGEYFARYWEKYGSKHPPLFIIDNDEKKWHTVKCGFCIESPDALKAKDKKGFVVIICSKHNLEMAKQLESMGIKDYRVF